MKGNGKFKGKWSLKGEIPGDVSEKENVVPYKNFNIVEKGHGEQYTRGDGRAPLHCWICGKDHHNRDCPQYQGGIPQIYSAQEAHIVGDVGHNIPQIYVTVENKKANHHESIIEMDGKLDDQVVSILIDPGSNYS